MSEIVKKRKRQENDSEDGEFLWLVSLSDLMILLFVFFVVLFSFSFKNMSAADLIEAVAVFNGDPDTPIDDINADIKASLSEKGLEKWVDVRQDGGELTVDIKDAILFDSGQFQLKPESRTLINSMSQVMGTIPSPYRIAVEGHTDDVPFGQHSAGSVADNWQLSLMRAYEVFQHLHFDGDLTKRASIVGFGSMKPLLPNVDDNGEPIPENRAKNRRVTIRVY